MNSNNHNNEIDLIPIVKKVWTNWKLVFRVSVFFALIGVVVALLSPIIYTSSSTFILSSGIDDKSSSIGGVASLVGINLGGMTNDSQIPAIMYPTVVESVEFKRKVLDEYIDQNKTLKLKSFLIDYYNVNLDDFTTKNNDFFVSEGDDNLFKILEKIIKISVNEKDGFVSISANMPTSEYAANTCVNARKILQTIVINTKIKSAKENLNFTQEQLNLKKIEFDEMQDRIAYFEDSNLNIINSKYKNELSKLRAEFQIINSVYTELSKRLEQSKLQVNQDTPVFSIVKEASMPVLRSSPKRTRMVLIFGVLGLLISVLYLICKEPLTQIIKEINS
tara:strand:- start:3636 stop:4637 length:1002 start_codon:yes stop_codon:yes gene_type:complete